MLCEGSPLLFYTPWGPVTPMGMYRGAPRLPQRTGEQTGERTGERRSIGPVLDYLVQSVAPGLDNLALPPLHIRAYPGQAEIQAGQRSRPGGDPGQAEIQAWA